MGKRKQPDDRETSESQSPAKKRTHKDGAADEYVEQRTKQVTAALASYFRTNRTGQCKKDQLLTKLNSEAGDKWTMGELEGALRRLHEENKIFFLDPMVHQL